MKPDETIPPLAEQHRIVARVDAVMALCERLKASLAAATSARRRLLIAEALDPCPPPPRL